MKILLISSYLPYPLYSGGQVRLYNLIKELSSKHEITLVCEKRRHQTQDDIKAVEEICHKVVTVERRNQWTVANVLKSAASPHSFLITGHMHAEMQEKISKLLGEQTFDLIHVETFYVAQNLPQIEIPVVLVEHNIEYLVYHKFLTQVPIYLKPLLQLDITKIKREEELYWKSATKLVAVSEDDKKVMVKAGFHPTVVANGVNTSQFTFQKKEKTALKKILFIGDFKLGRVIPDSIKNLTNDPDVLFDEESSARPTPEIFQEAAVLLAPIRVGGGTSYKILESMSSGTPVVTRKMSADAIHAKDGDHLMIGHTPSELAEKTVKLLEDDKLTDAIVKQARTLIEERYTWKMIAKKLEEVYTTI
ncbi:glycosyltransferase family 4 protein [Candidatus Microgenomates bacterium]|nr:glycosyltransferase family 4 protein [Candidatus Microgenomates bacterium]